jgi:LMBR1-like membrane protein
VKPKVFSIIAIIATVMSIQLVAGEMIILFKLKFSLFDLLTMSKLLQYGVSIIFLLYMSLCIYYGLFNLKLTSFYELHPNQQTDPFSLLYSANFLTKLAPPLCFNFLKIINVEGTAFHRFLGVQDPIPLIGEDFQKLFPATLLFLCLFNLFDVWTKLMVFMGLEDFTFAGVADEAKINDG